MKSGIGARAMLWLVMLFLYAPVVVLIVYSFNDARFSVGWEGFTLDWYRRLFDSAETAAAVRSTLLVSLSATALATVLGTLLAIGMHLRPVPARGVLDLLLYLPIVAPDIVVGVAMLAFYVAVNFPLGRASIALAHVGFQIPFVALVVRARLQDFPREVLEAARDLGADEVETIRRIVLPIVRPGVIAGALIALAHSVDDFVVAYFTAGAGASTLPIRIYSMVKRGVTPDINALSTLLLVATLVLIVAALRLQRREPGEPR
jgi:spermidine/putrescine transport system permease protein